jgi:tetratricopeptide (TPR) repeat protein
LWRTSLALLAAASIAPALIAPVPAHARAPLDPESLSDARAGLDHLYHARIEEAREAFERIRARHPASPAADFLLGGVEWHRVTTGPAGFTEGGAAEASFFRRMDEAIRLGEAAVRDDPADASARFFLGGAYGYKARYLAIQEKWWSAYRTGKAGVGHLERVVEQAPDLADAYLGLGIYHYYADVLPSIFRFLGTFVGIRGDRERGLEEIRRALAEGDLVDVEARFFLAELHTSFEDDHWTALGWSRSLRDEFPENELFAWLNARILDELHLAAEADAEWRALRERPRDASLRGFLDYRLVRTRLYGGDFEGAAEDFARELPRGFGSDRITMWGRVRYGLCLDFLGRHAEAMEQYRLARRLDASPSAAERASGRLAAGDPDPSRISLAELAETARILRAARPRDEAAIRRTEERVRDPSRGMSQADRDLFFAILADLAEARLLRGDPAACLAAVERALDSWRDVPKDARARLESVRAKALFRAGRAGEAMDAWGRAYSRASSELREAVGRDREAARRALALPPAPEPAGPGPSLTVTVPDGGEVLLELEADLPEGARIPLALRDGAWTVTCPAPDERPVRYRLVADGVARRIDPFAPRVVVVDHEPWSVRDPR